MTGMTFQDAMKQYCEEGHNQSFIYLYQLILQKQQFGNADLDSLAFDIKKCCDSFGRCSKKLWAILSSPFAKEGVDDMEDFIVSEEEIDSSNVHSAILIHNSLQNTKLSPEDQIIQELRKRCGKDRESGSPFDGSEGENENEKQEEQCLGCCCCI